MRSRRQAADARVSGPTSASLRVTRSGPGDVVARVTLSRPDVHNAFDASLIGDLRTAFATLARESTDAASGRRPGRRWAVLLRRRRHRLDARRDGAGRRRATSRTRWRWPTCSRPSTPARCRSSPASTARPSVAAWGCARCPTSSSPSPGRASASPRRGSGSCRRSSARSSSPRSARPTPGRSSRAAGDSTPPAPPGSGWSTRSSKARRRSTEPSMRRSRTCLPPGRPRRERPRRSSARSAVWATDRPSGTRPGSSRDSATSEEAQEGFRAFTEKRRPAWAPDPDDA